MKLIHKKLISLLFFIILIFNFGCNKDKRDWTKAEQQRTISAFRDYLNMHPQGKFVPAANKQLEELEWNDAVEKNTKESYKTFLLKHSEGNLAAKAKDKIEYIEKIEWDDVINLQTSDDSYKNYLHEEYPESKESQEAVLQSTLQIIISGGLSLKTAVLSKIEPNIYQIGKTNNSIISGNVAVFAYGCSFFTFPVSKPTAFAFDKYVKIDPPKKEAYFSPNWKRPSLLKVASVAEKMENYGIEVQKAYRFGVIENGSYIVGVRLVNSNLEDVLPAIDAGLQEVEFDIPESVGGIKIGQKSDDIFVIKGRTLGHRLFMELGFKLTKRENRKYEMNEIKRQIINLGSTPLQLK